MVNGMKTWLRKHYVEHIAGDLYCYEEIANTSDEE